RALDIELRLSKFHRAELEAQRAIDHLHLSELIGRKGIGKDSDTTDAGQHFLEDPQPFGQQVEVKEKYPGDVAAGPSDAGDLAERERVVVDADHDDGDRCGCFLRGTGRGSDGGEDEVDVQVDQVSREGRKPLDLAVGAPIFEDKVLILDVSEITQPLPEILK